MDELDRDIADMEEAAARLKRELSTEIESTMRELEIQLQEATEHMPRHRVSTPASDT